MLKFGLLGILKISSLALLVFSLSESTGIPFRDPWFDISATLWIFSAVTGGMPEPSEQSAFGYIWLYRTLHLLSANGTAYFIHPKKWKDISGEDCTPTTKEP